VAGWPVRLWAAAMARWRTASGLGVGMPRPWRPKALRSDGQVVPSSLAAAFTLPNRSASWKARSASARSERERLGCQPSGGDRARTLSAMSGVLSEAVVEQGAATADGPASVAGAWRALPQHGAWVG
jgi:hypothetical protein